MCDSDVAEWVEAQLGCAHDAPIFAGCGFWKPHLPWYARQPDFDQHPLDESVLAP